MCCFTKPLTWEREDSSVQKQTMKQANYARQFSFPLNSATYKKKRSRSSTRKIIMNSVAGTWRKAGTSFHFSSSSPTGLASSCWEPSCQSSPICKARLSLKGEIVFCKVKPFLGRSNYYILLLHQQGQTISYGFEFFLEGLEPFCLISSQHRSLAALK